jgi:glycosyltransferase involved in cell wall biosynthesis
MKVLFIAPIPPPVTGHSLVSEVLKVGVERDHEIVLVNLSKSGHTEGLGYFIRFFEIASVLREVNSKKKGVDVVYFTISESFLGNSKDLLIYIAIFSLLPRTYIHLHGGSIKRLLWEKCRFIYLVNKFFIKRLAGVFITGESHRQIFYDILPRKKIHIVPNFALDSLIITSDRIVDKFNRSETLRIVFVSGMKKLKGYEELLIAYIKLSDSYREKVAIDFAGSFETDELREKFESAIIPYMNIKYHGSINGIEKQELFAKAHVFCLPTMFFEGQPVSILEAYASGCIVLTTGQSGILDIFVPGVNGYEIDRQDLSGSISNLIIKILGSTVNENLSIAITNSNLAKTQYKVETFCSTLKSKMGLLNE